MHADRAASLSPGLQSRLAERLAAPPASLLVVSGDPAHGADLERAGYRVRWLPAPGSDASAEQPGPGGPPGEEEGGRGDGSDPAAVVLPLAGAPFEPWLEAVADWLPTGARLAVVGTFTAELSRRLTRALHENALAVLSEEEIAGPGPQHLWTARREEHRIRPYRPGDETAILDLFERAFHVRRSVERWRWEYAANPYGNHKISVAIDAAGGLAAHYAGYLVRFWTDLPGASSTLECLQIGDTMTAPEARRVGRGRTNLLTRTVGHFYATHCEGKVAFNYGVNTGKIRRFTRRTAGGVRLEPVPFRVCSPRRMRASPAGRLHSLLLGWRVERVDRFDERWDGLWRRARAAYRFLVERDRRYLDWRYADCPESGYSIWAVLRWGRLVGWSVFRREESRLIWGDALFDPAQPRAPRVLLAAVAAAPEHRDVERLEGWLTDRPAWWGRIVEELGFAREREPEDLGITYVPFELDPSTDIAAHLYYTKGDFDLF